MRRVLAALGRHKGWSIGGGVFAALVVIGGINSAVSGPAANSGAQAAASSPAAVTAPAPAASTPAVAPSSPVPVVASSSPASLPPKPSPAPSVLVVDNPAFDLTGSGDACKMHYFQDDQGRTVTLFNLSVDGELITHVSGPDGIGRHDQQESAGVVRIVYDFPLSQATDMGAVLYLADGTQQSCTIAAGSDAP